MIRFHFRFWHFADMLAVLTDVPASGASGRLRYSHLAPVNFPDCGRCRCSERVAFYVRWARPNLDSANRLWSLIIVRILF